MESHDNRPRRPRFIDHAPKHGEKHGDETGGPERETEVVETSSLRARRPATKPAAHEPSAPEPAATESEEPAPSATPDRSRHGSRR